MVHCVCGCVAVHDGVCGRMVVQYGMRLRIYAYDGGCNMAHDDVCWCMTALMADEGN